MCCSASDVANCLNLLGAEDVGAAAAVANVDHRPGILDVAAEAAGRGHSAPFPCRWSPTASALQRGDRLPSIPRAVGATKPLVERHGVEIGGDQPHAVFAAQAGKRRLQGLQRPCAIIARLAGRGAHQDHHVARPGRPRAGRAAASSKRSSWSHRDAQNNRAGLPRGPAAPRTAVTANIAATMVAHGNTRTAGKDC